jgi:undecaprenyl-diphosphatase
VELALWQIVVLAVVQGVTEFLPVSSSGHLVVVAALLSPENADKLDVADVNIALHLGTLLSIVVYYHKTIARLLTEDRRAIGLLIVATLPAVLVGLPLYVFAKQALSSTILAGCMLIVTGIILLWATRIRHGTERYQEMSYGKALWIGASQALAILPGLSRSGTTISTGIAARLSPRSAATFSFLMAIVAILGAGTLEAVKIAREGTSGTHLGWLVVGALVAFVVGLAALWALIRVLDRGRLSWFAWWCIPLGIAVIAWRLAAMLSTNSP